MMVMVLVVVVVMLVMMLMLVVVIILVVVVMMLVLMVVLVMLIMVMVMLMLVLGLLELVLAAHLFKQLVAQRHLLDGGEDGLAVQLVPRSRKDGSSAAAASNFSCESFCVRERMMVPAASIWLL